MTTEDDFHNHLDQHPDDHHARQVFADFLQEQGDPRAEGYRALGKLERVPQEDMGVYWYSTPQYSLVMGASNLPNIQWLRSIPSSTGHLHLRQRDTRREMEDAAALAFGQLPPETKTEILSSTQYSRDLGPIKYSSRRRSIKQ